MSRVLTDTLLDAGPRRLAALAPDVVDPTVRDLVDRARAEGYERGLRDGHARGAAEADAAGAQRVEQLAGALTTAVTEVARTVRASRDDTVEAAFELAVAIAEAVLGHEPADGGAAVAGQVRETLARLADPHPVVHVSPDDAELVTAALADLRDVTVQADPSLAAGDARVRGAWAEADLTRATAFATIRRELGVDAH